MERRHVSALGAGERKQRTRPLGQADPSTALCGAGGQRTCAEVVARQGRVVRRLREVEAMRPTRDDPRVRGVKRLARTFVELLEDDLAQRARRRRDEPFGPHDDGVAPEAIERGLDERRIEQLGGRLEDPLLGRVRAREAHEGKERLVQRAIGRECADTASDPPARSEGATAARAFAAWHDDRGAIVVLSDGEITERESVAKRLDDREGDPAAPTGPASHDLGAHAGTARLFDSCGGLVLRERSQRDLGLRHETREGGWQRVSFVDADDDGDMRIGHARRMADRLERRAIHQRGVVDQHPAPLVVSVVERVQPSVHEVARGVDVDTLPREERAERLGVGGPGLSRAAARAS